MTDTAEYIRTYRPDPRSVRSRVERAADSLLSHPGLECAAIQQDIAAEDLQRLDTRIEQLRAELKSATEARRQLEADVAHQVHDAVVEVISRSGARAERDFHEGGRPRASIAGGWLTAYSASEPTVQRLSEVSGVQRIVTTRGRHTVLIESAGTVTVVNFDDPAPAAELAGTLRALTGT